MPPPPSVTYELLNRAEQLSELTRPLYDLRFYDKREGGLGLGTEGLTTDLFTISEGVDGSDNIVRAVGLQPPTSSSPSSSSPSPSSPLSSPLPPSLAHLEGDPRAGLLVPSVTHGDDVALRFTPGARSGHSLHYSSAIDRIVLVGGMGYRDLHNDVWVGRVSRRRRGAPARADADGALPTTATTAATGCDCRRKGSQGGGGLRSDAEDWLDIALRAEAEAEAAYSEEHTSTEEAGVGIQLGCASSDVSAAEAGAEGESPLLSALTEIPPFARHSAAPPADSSPTFSSLVPQAPSGAPWLRGHGDHPYMRDARTYREGLICARAEDKSRIALADEAAAAAMSATNNCRSSVTGGGVGMLSGNDNVQGTSSADGNEDGLGASTDNSSWCEHCGASSSSSSFPLPLPAASTVLQSEWVVVWERWGSIRYPSNAAAAEEEEEEGASETRPRCFGHAACLFDNDTKLFVHGGMTDNNRSTDAPAYLDLFTRRWCPITFRRSPREAASVAEADRWTNGNGGEAAAARAVASIGPRWGHSASLVRIAPSPHDTAFLKTAEATAEDCTVGGDGRGGLHASGDSCTEAIVVIGGDVWSGGTMDVFILWPSPPALSSFSSNNGGRGGVGGSSGASGHAATSWFCETVNNAASAMVIRDPNERDAFDSAVSACPAVAAARAEALRALSRKATSRDDNDNSKLASGGPSDAEAIAVAETTPTPTTPAAAKSARAAAASVRAAIRAHLPRPIGIAIPTARRRHAAAAHNGRFIFIFGGRLWNERNFQRSNTYWGNFLSDTWVFDASRRRWLLLSDELLAPSDVAAFLSSSPLPLHGLNGDEDGEGGGEDAADGGSAATSMNVRASASVSVAFQCQEERPSYYARREDDGEAGGGPLLWIDLTFSDTDGAIGGEEEAAEADLFGGGDNQFMARRGPRALLFGKFTPKARTGCCAVVTGEQRFAPPPQASPQASGLRDASAEKASTANISLHPLTTDSPLEQQKRQQRQQNHFLVYGGFFAQHQDANGTSFNDLRCLSLAPEAAPYAPVLPRPPRGRGRSLNLSPSTQPPLNAAHELPSTLARSADSGRGRETAEALQTRNSTRGGEGSGGDWDAYMRFCMEEVSAVEEARNTAAAARASLLINDGGCSFSNAPPGMTMSAMVEIPFEGMYAAPREGSLNALRYADVGAAAEGPPLFKNGKSATHTAAVGAASVGAAFGAASAAAGSTESAPNSSEGAADTAVFTHRTWRPAVEKASEGLLAESDADHHRRYDVYAQRCAAEGRGRSLLFVYGGRLGVAPVAACYVATVEEGEGGEGGSPSAAFSPPSSITAPNSLASRCAHWFARHVPYRPKYTHATNSTYPSGARPPPLRGADGTPLRTRLLQAAMRGSAAAPVEGAGDEDGGEEDAGEAVPSTAFGATEKQGVVASPDDNRRHPLALPRTVRATIAAASHCGTVLVGMPPSASSVASNTTLSPLASSISDTGSRGIASAAIGAAVTYHSGGSGGAAPPHEASEPPPPRYVAPPPRSPAAAASVLFGHPVGPRGEGVGSAARGTLLSLLSRLDSLRQRDPLGFAAVPPVAEEATGGGGAGVGGALSAWGRLRRRPQEEEGNGLPRGRTVFPNGDDSDSNDNNTNSSDEEYYYNDEEEEGEAFDAQGRERGDDPFSDALSDDEGRI